MNLRQVISLSVLSFNLSSYAFPQAALAQDYVNLPQEPPIAQNAEVDSLNDSSTLMAQRLNCQNIGRFNYRLQSKMNLTNQASIRISKRKSLEIHGIESLSLNGCQIVARVRVTLHRRRRRNAHGTVTIRGNASLNGNRVCLNGVKVTSVNLSRTLRVGERIYRRVANRALGGQLCHTI